MGSDPVPVIGNVVDNTWFLLMWSDPIPMTPLVTGYYAPTLWDVLQGHIIFYFDKFAPFLSSLIQESLPFLMSEDR